MNMNMISDDSNRSFLLSATIAALLIILSFGAAGTVSAETEEAVFVKPAGSLYAPLYPRDFSSMAAIVTAEKDSRYKLVKEIPGGYIVECEDGLFVAPSRWYVFEELAGESVNASKNKEFDASDFFRIELPKEIETSEFFFNNASIKSFHSLAFLLFLKNGPKFDGYEQKLRDYDDFVAAAAKKKTNPTAIEAFCAFLNSGGPKAAVCMKRRLTAEIAYGLLESHKPLVFMSFANGADGDIVVAYSLTGREGFAKEAECYIYGTGLKKFSWSEFEKILDSSSNIFMVLM